MPDSAQTSGAPSLFLTTHWSVVLAAKDRSSPDREKGRFRTFLSVALRRFLANEWDRSRRLKRGGRHTPLSFDTTMAEQRYQADRDDALAPDRLYERRWAGALLSQALARLRAEYAAAGKTADFELLKGVLAAERGGIAYGDIATALNLSEGGGTCGSAPVAQTVPRGVPCDRG